MQILLADAKTMNEESSQCVENLPLFDHIAQEIASEMAGLSPDELQNLFGVSEKVALQTFRHYRDFSIATKLPALFAYSGQAYRHLDVQTLSRTDIDFGSKHLFITSFLYGLLRPLDGIVPYRMEQGVQLVSTNNLPVSQYWRDRVTALLLEAIQSDDGVLLQLATEEYKSLFHWKELRKKVNIVTPYFYVQKGDKLQVQAVWAKSCRGAMVRYILKHKIDAIERLKEFDYEGFHFDPTKGDREALYFVRVDPQ